ncbi:MAG: hypothetical protein ACYTEU_06535, partial [Planctomycetota bacterium]
MRIPYRLLGDILWTVGKWGGKGALNLTGKIAFTGLYGLSQAAFKENLQRMDDFLGGDELARDSRGNYALLEFEVELYGEIIPVQIRWKEQRDAYFYTFCLMAATFIYWSAVRYLWVKFRNVANAYNDARIAANAAELARATEELRSVEDLIKQQENVIERTIEFVKSGATGDTQEIIDLTVESLETQLDDVRN